VRHAPQRPDQSMRRGVAMRIKLSTTAQDLHDAIDAAWHRERREPTCPECDGSRISENGRCWNCTASDYLEETR
jgi:hypothetical protein